MIREHREEKAATPLAEMPETEVLDAAGAAFAALVLTGKAALSRRSHTDEADIAMRDAASLPGAARVGDILASRLFMAKEPERFGYAHRAIGEFLGARWLAKNADTTRKRRRLLELFTHQSLVPASLRGLHAWLAWHGPSLAIDVIATDPMGVIEYGDADRLTPAEGRAMFAALQALSRENPRFRAWSQYRLAGLAQKDLLPEVAEVLTGPDVEFGLRLLVLQALEGSALVSDLSEILTSMVVDATAVFATRSAAGERLAGLEAGTDWSGIVDQLRAQNTTDSLRLASELMDEVGFDRFSDAQILAVALSMMSQSDRMVGVYTGMQRNLPDGRIDALLSGIASATMDMEDRRAHPGYSAITDLAFGLFARRLAIGGLDAETVWAWMRPFDSGGSMYGQSRKAVADFLASDSALRQAIQRHVLLDLPGEKNVWQRAWRLNERFVGLNPTEDDILALLETLTDDDPARVMRRSGLHPALDAATASHRVTIVQGAPRIGRSRLMRNWSRKRDDVVNVPFPGNGGFVGIEIFDHLRREDVDQFVTRVAATIAAKRVSIPYEEARELALRAVRFKQERGRLPDITSQDAWEKRLAEGVAALARYRAQQQAANG